ncbi:hypothetical protein [Streptosporangium sp. NPDC049046]|uniref:hypothetical protein n=1 Tax=Streptosporangium sp. NPDC049046 TaxID=3155031 RepID=UPI00342CD7A2
MSKTSWDKEAAARVQPAAAKNPDSPNARDGLDREAQSRALAGRYGQDDRRQAGGLALVRERVV